MSEARQKAHEAAATAKMVGEVRRAWGLLQNAESFAVGGFGIFRQTSREELALHTLLRQQNARLLLRGLLETARPAGQMYALLGLRRLLSPAGFGACAAQFRASRQRVTTSSGCMDNRETVGAVVARIEQNYYNGYGNWHE